MSQPSCRFLPYVLLPFLALYGIWLFLRARAELLFDDEVVGLFRTYRAPYLSPDGFVLDPRPGPLLPELITRYAPGAPVPREEPKDQAAWAERLAALGVASKAAQGFGDGPRLLFVKPRPWLQIGTFEFQPVVFDPARGVVLLGAPTLPWNTPALQLLTEERPD